MIYIYSKRNDVLQELEPVLDMIATTMTPVTLQTEAKRSFREWNTLKMMLTENDIMVVPSMACIGLNNAAIANELEWFIAHQRLLVIADITSTYEYGVSQPMNSAVLQTLAQYTVQSDKNVISIQIGRKASVGRNKIDFPENWDELYDQWTEGKISSKEFLNATGLKKATFYNLVTEYKTMLKAKDAFREKYRIS